MALKTVVKAGPVLRLSFVPLTSTVSVQELTSTEAYLYFGGDTMTRFITTILSLALPLVGICAGALHAVETLPMPTMPPARTLILQEGPAPEFLTREVPPVEKTAPGMFKMGEIVINKKDRSVSFPALLNQKDGLLEYLIVNGRGKVHESLFRTNVEPYYLNLALLLLEFEGTDRPLQYQGDHAIPKGEALSITVSYEAKDNKKVAVSPEKWIVRRKYDDSSVQQDAGEFAWVYTGARIINGRFSAQTGGSIAAVYHDPDAMIDNASPGGESDKIWFVKEGVVPPIGTSVTITIKPAK